MLPLDASEKIPPTVIRASDLWCGYASDPVLKGISFQIRRGEFVGVLGPNGSGKTTLLLALTGILPPSGGSIEIFGDPLAVLNSRSRAKRMATVSQNAEVRFPFSCEEVVRMGRYPHQKRWRMDSPEDASVVRRAMEITETVELAERLITAVSGGEKQRVTMAKALAQDTPLLLLDEATSAMDIHRKLRVFGILERLNRERQLTVLAVLHDVNLAALYCDRMIFLKEGKLAADGPTSSLLVPEILEGLYQTRVQVHEVAGTGKRQVFFLP